MSVFDYKYLTKENLAGFDKYKYCCIDNSPLSVYVSHPFWNWLVNFYPKWLAPNVLTLVGWALVMGCFFVECYLDYNLTNNSVGSTNPVPDWFWMFAAICTFLGHTLDGTDGKQARRIGASGPTGELFDHGLDSWSTVPFTITIFSVFGYGQYSVPPVNLLFILLSVQLVFYATHWEKYNTGVMFLSWGYDASQFGLVAIYLLTYIVGYQWFKFYIFGDFCLANALELGFYIICVLSIIMSTYNVMVSLNNKTAKHTDLLEILRPGCSLALMVGACVYWALFSKTNIVERDPRMFFFCVGTVFSSIACHLIICQMSSQRAALYNFVLAFYIATAGFALLLPDYELLLLRLSTIVITFLHVHYGASVVRQLCAHFKIYAFDVSYLEERK